MPLLDKSAFADPTLPVPTWSNIKSAWRGLMGAVTPPDPYEEAGRMVQQARGGDYLGALETGFGAMPNTGAIKAYHGSPHSFDKFDLSKIGTGEGAQAYGHGLYFADNEAVARSYRDALSQTGVHMMRNGEKVGYVPTGHIANDPEFVKAYQELIPAADVPNWIKGGIMRDLYSSGQLGETLDRAKMADVTRERLLKELQHLPDEQKSKIGDVVNRAYSSIPADIEFKRPGHMYEVRINAEPEHFLDWDKPLSEHPEAIRRKIGWTPELEQQYLSAQRADDDALLAALEGSGNYSATKLPIPQGLPPLSATGQDIVRGGSVFDRAAKAEKLREAGIPGIKYLDQGSRGAGEGSRNYVVFDDKLVDIMRKYGLAPFGIGGLDVMGGNQEQK